MSNDAITSKTEKEQEKKNSMEKKRRVPQANMSLTHFSVK